MNNHKFHSKASEDKKIDKPNALSAEKKLENLFSGISESVLTASDQEIEEEMEIEGLDPSAESERVRDLLLKFAQNQASRVNQKKV